MGNETPTEKPEETSTKGQDKKKELRYIKGGMVEEAIKKGGVLVNDDLPDVFIRPPTITLPDLRSPNGIDLTKKPVKSTPKKKGKIQ